MLHSVARPGSTGIRELHPGSGAALTSGYSLASLRDTGLDDALLCKQTKCCPVVSKWRMNPGGKRNPVGSTTFIAFAKDLLFLWLEFIE